MTRLFLPESAVRSLLSEQERYWNPILKRLDPLLRLIPPQRRPPVGMLPNRWHIARINEQGVENYIAITTGPPDFGFREMDEAMLDALKRRDLQSTRSERIRREEQATRLACAERAKQRASEDRVDSIAARIANKTRPSILFSDDVRFKNKAHARDEAA